MQKLERFHVHEALWPPVFWIQCIESFTSLKLSVVQGECTVWVSYESFVEFSFDHDYNYVFAASHRLCVLRVKLHLICRFDWWLFQLHSKSGQATSVWLTLAQKYTHDKCVLLFFRRYCISVLLTGKWCPRKMTVRSSIRHPRMVVVFCKWFPMIPDDSFSRESLMFCSCEDHVYAFKFYLRP